MTRKNTPEDIIKNMEDFENLELFLNKSKKLYQELSPFFKSKPEDNIIFMHLSHTQFSIFIIPFLSTKDILTLRQANKELNILINSNICCINYYQKISKQTLSLNQISSFQNNKNDIKKLKPLHELSDESALLDQKNILADIKKFITSKNYTFEKLNKLYKVEMQYLKYEDKHQKIYMKSLLDEKKKINEEYNSIKAKNKKCDSWVKIEIASESGCEKSKDKIEEEFNEDEMKKKIQKLKLEKEDLLTKIKNIQKYNDELRLKNKNNQKIVDNFESIIQNDDNFIKYDNEEDLEEINKFILSD